MIFNNFLNKILVHKSRTENDRTTKITFIEKENKNIVGAASIFSQS